MTLKLKPTFEELEHWIDRLPYDRYLQTNTWQLFRGRAWHRANYQSEFSGERPAVWEDMEDNGLFDMDWLTALSHYPSLEWMSGFHVHHVKYRRLCRTRALPRDLIGLTADEHERTESHEKFKEAVATFAGSRHWLNVTDETGIAYGDHLLPRDRLFEALTLDYQAYHAKAIGRQIFQQRLRNG